MITKYIKVVTALIKLISYWTALIFYVRAKGFQTVGGYIGTIIGIMLFYYLVYCFLFPQVRQQGQCLKSTCKKTFPATLISALGLLQLFTSLEMYRLLLGEHAQDMCKKYGLSILGGIGNSILMGALIGSSKNSTPKEVSEFYKFAQISSFISIGTTILGILLQFCEKCKQSINSIIPAQSSSIIK